MAAAGLLEQLTERLDEMTCGDAIEDDRDKLTVGRRLQDARRIGYPYVILVGKKAAVAGGPLVELHLVNEDRVEELGLDELMGVLQSKLLRHSISK